MLDGIGGCLMWEWVKLRDGVITIDIVVRL